MAKKTRTDAERFWSKVEKGEGCWLWKGSLVKGVRYGQFRVGSRTSGDYRMVKAHRFAYELVKGPIPSGLLVRHSCDNPSCVNPAHLDVGTNADNSRDMVERGRSLKGEGSPVARLTDEQVAEIRRLYGPAQGRIGRARQGVTQKALAEKYGVTQVHISHIVRGTTRPCRTERISTSTRR